MINADACPAEIFAVPKLKDDELRHRWITVSRVLMNAKSLFQRGVASFDSAEVIAHLENNELELALKNLMELGTKSLNVDGWRWLRIAADEMGSAESIAMIDELENQRKGGV